MATQQTSAIQAQETNTLQALMDVVKPQISNMVFAKQNYLLPVNVFKTKGMLRPIMGEVSYHYELGNAHPNFQTSSTVSGGVGADITITVSANSTYEGDVYARVSDTVRFKNRTAGKVITKNDLGGSYELVIRPFDVNGSLSTTNGDFLWILGNGQAEGSSGVAGRFTKKEKLAYPLQIFREAYDATGSALTNELWYSRDQNGQSRTTYNSGVFDTEFRYWEQWGNMILFNPLNQNTSTITESYSYSMEYLVSSGGLDLPYNSGNYGLTEFEAQIRYVNQNKGASGNKFMGLVGPEFNLSANKGLRDIFTQNPIIFSGEGKDNWIDGFTQGSEADFKNAGINIGFRSVNYSNIQFYWCQVEQLGLNTSGGAAGFDETEYAFWIPLTKGITSSADMKDRMVINYKKKDQWDRMCSVVQTGRNAPVPTNTTDNLVVDYLGHFGLETTGIEGFQICRPN